MKKIKNLLLASGLALLLLPTSAQAFSDTSGHWAEGFINEAYEAGLMTGRDGDTFDPDGTMTLAEFAVVVANGAFGGETRTPNNSHWAASYVTVLSGYSLTSDSKGEDVIGNGYALYSDLYDQPITREDVASIIIRVLEQSKLQPLTFYSYESLTDLNLLKTGSFQSGTNLIAATQGQFEDITSAITANIMTGKSDTQFGIGEPLTRSAVSVIISKMLARGGFSAVNSPSANTPSVDKYPSVDKTPSTDTSTPSVDKYPSVDKTPSTDTSTPSVDKTPSTDTGTTTGTSQAELIAEVFRLVNVERAKVGLSPLIWHDTLMKAAQFKSDEMVELDYFSHTSPVYGSFSGIINLFNISWRTCGENIAMGQRTAEAVMTSWMNSTGHKENILSSSYTHIGIGVNNYVWTQQFIA